MKQCLSNFMAQNWLVPEELFALERETHRSEKALKTLEYCVIVSNMLEKLATVQYKLKQRAMSTPYKEQSLKVTSSIREEVNVETVIEDGHVSGISQCGTLASEEVISKTIVKVGLFLQKSISHTVNYMWLCQESRARKN